MAFPDIDHAFVLEIVKVTNLINGGFDVYKIDSHINMNARECNGEGLSAELK